MRELRRWLLLTAAALVALQLFFFIRIALMVVVNPQSTSFERSQAWQLARQGQLRWAQQWQDYDKLSDNLKRAVVASEDDGFTAHGGVDWKAIEQAARRNARLRASAGNGSDASLNLRGGSTITQQLAKNLLLSGEQSLLRKGQELILAYVLEALLDKRRILEIYLNHVEWGEGVFGAEAAARHYFDKSASQLTAWEAARLAVMLPHPRHYEQHPGSGYLAQRTASILSRMHRSQLP